MKTRLFPGLVLVLVLLFLGAVSGCLAAGPVELSGRGVQTPVAFSLTSPAFAEGGDIPSVYTCDGEERSPALRWSDPPAGTQSFALIADDPDLPGGTFTHWVLYNIPASTNELPEGLQAGQVGTSGNNDFGRTGYGGPCPPSGTHRYYFTLYALDLPSVDLTGNTISSQGGLRRAMQEHVLGRAQLMGRYSRK